MKRIIGALAMAAVVAAMGIGCSSQDGATGTATGDVTAGTLVSRADLVAALWSDASAGVEKTATNDATCLATSTFIVRGAAGFAIRANALPSETNATPAVVVSSINIEITDEAGVQRGPDCAAGEIAYVVTASEEQPIDVIASEEAAATKPTDDAAAEAAPYAAGCDVIAHFEQHGDLSCAAATDEGDEGIEEAKAEEVAEETGEEIPEPIDCEDQPAVQTFKLVVDQVLCDGAEVPAAEAL